MSDTKEIFQLTRANISVNAELFLKLAHDCAKHNNTIDRNAVLITPHMCFTFGGIMYNFCHIAEASLHISIILGLGIGVRILSGLFRVGVRFIETPPVIFFGLPPTVAVATEDAQIVDLSRSGVLAQLTCANHCCVR